MNSINQLVTSIKININELLSMMIEITSLSPSQRGICPEELYFGETFSDHMFIQHFTLEHSWHNAVICPYQSLPLEPFAAFLHSNQKILEGLKAYRNVNGDINLFRPEDNVKRFNRSAKRMLMPEIDESLHLEAIKSLVYLDQDWVPDKQGAFLLIRQIMIAASTKLYHGSSRDYSHYIITRPAGSYFKGELIPISVFVADEYRRAVKDGNGEFKTGGSHMPSILNSEEVIQLGYSQVLLLDPVEGRYIENVGEINIYFVYEGKHVVTPVQNGNILPCIIHDSILKLAPALGYEISEQCLDIDDVLAGIDSGKITEAFGSGTAADILPVGKFEFKGKEYVINNNKTGDVARELYNELTGIQYGTREDKFGWVVPL